MKTISLNGQWELSFGNYPAAGELTLSQATAWETLPATVPGNVELDLLAAGRLRDLVKADGIYQLRHLESLGWCYRRSFLSPAFAAGEQVLLSFGGIDCVAVIYLNGELLGRSANMLIEHEFDVTSRLRPGAQNDLAVLISSPILEARKHRFSPAEHSAECRWESLPIRKAPHMYGWDIMPRVVSAGLWRGVTLEVRTPLRWRDVYWSTLSTSVSERTATLLADWDFVTPETSVDDLRLRIVLSRGGRVCYQQEHAVFETHGRTQVSLNDVELWWPRGMGPAPLYEAALELLHANGQLLHRHVTRIGIRTAELRRSDITTETQPGEFLFLINGERVFVKGTNWVPLDALHSRDPQHLDAAVDMAADLNCNMIRCWGGNVYEDHDFFSRCDERGIMVWQDFALACSIYPQDDVFAAQIRAEAETVVRKLRNHPSLVLWAGNNEIDDAYLWAKTGLDPNTHDRLSRQVLPEVVRRLDPLRPYLPSSPYRSPSLIEAGGGDHLKPEDHLWGPRNDYKGAYYTTSPAYFVSEIGYHGCPARQSLEAMIDPSHLWPPQNNPQWLIHGVRPLPGIGRYDYRIDLMTRQIGVLFDHTPDCLDDYIFASQASQAEALKFFIERWRIGKWRRTGILWWNLRDGWPIISDAIVDYYNRRKLAYGYVKRCQTDVCLMCDEARDGKHSLIAVNDTRSACSGSVTVHFAGGALLLSAAFKVAAGAVAYVASLPASDAPQMWFLDYCVAGELRRNHYLAGPRPINLSQYRRWIAALEGQS